MKEEKKILVTDIGGTNSRFAIFTCNSGGNSGEISLENKIVFPTSSVSSISELFKLFLASELSETCISCLEAIVVAAAGPVTDGRYCDPPNIPWKIDIEDLRVFFEPSQKILLINDFVAQAFSCISPLGKTAETIKEGTRNPRGTIAVLGPGTGLGKSILVNTAPNKTPNSNDEAVEQNFIGVPSEGGHTNYPVENEQELKLAQFICKKHDVSYATMEQVISGDGLSSIMEFLSGKPYSPEETSKLLTKGEFPEVKEIYMGAIAKICRCFALETLCSGGLYIAGGVIAKNRYLVESEIFTSIFMDAPTQGPFIEKVPVFILSSDDSGLWGAAQYGLKR